MAALTGWLVRTPEARLARVLCGVSCENITSVVILRRFPATNRTLNTTGGTPAGWHYRP